MRKFPYARLSIMMLLQYAVWGAWLPILARYLSAPPILIEVSNHKALCTAIRDEGQGDQDTLGKRMWNALEEMKKKAAQTEAGAQPQADEKSALEAVVAAADKADGKLTAETQGKITNALDEVLAVKAFYKDVDISDMATEGKSKEVYDRAMAGGELNDGERLSLNRLVLKKSYPDFISVRKGGLAFTGTQIGLLLGLAGSIGALVAPFLAGQFADRYFSAERFLALMLVIGGVIKWLTAYQLTYGMWLFLSIAYSVVYMPTLALTNSIAFAHMTDQEKQFPVVRVWGTLGWIIASWVFPMIWLQTNLSLSPLPPFLVGTEVADVTQKLALALVFSGVMSICYGVFCLFLPHTPPKKDAVEKLAFAKAFKLLKKPSFALIFLVSLPISVIHQIYFMQTSPFFSAIGVPDSYIGPAMTIGQFFELIVMALLGVMLAKLGFRWVITIGALAYAARYGVFGTVDLPMGVIVASQFLHGFCYACFFAGTYIYVDRIAPEDVRHSAQTLYGIFILGLGPVIGGWFSGWLTEYFKLAGNKLDYSGIWYTQAVIGLIVAVLIAAFFRSEVQDEPATAEAGGQETETKA